MLDMKTQEGWGCGAGGHGDVLPAALQGGGDELPSWSVVSGHPSAVSSFRGCRELLDPRPLGVLEASVQWPPVQMELERPAFGFNRGVSARLS